MGEEGGGNLLIQNVISYSVTNKNAAHTRLPPFLASCESLLGETRSASFPLPLSRDHPSVARRRHSSRPIGFNQNRGHVAWYRLEAPLSASPPDSVSRRSPPSNLPSDFKLVGCWSFMSLHHIRPYRLPICDSVDSCILTGKSG